MKSLDIKTLPKNLKKNDFFKKSVPEEKKLKIKRLKSLNRRFKTVTFLKKDNYIGMAIKKLVKVATLVCTVFIVFLIFITIGYANKFRSIYKTAMKSKDYMVAVQEQIKNQQIEEAHNSIKQAKQILDETDKKFKTIRWLKVVPILGRQVKTADRIFKASSQTINILDQTFEAVKIILSPIINESTKNLYGITSQQKGEIMKNLHQMAPVFQGAISDIKLTHIELNKIPNFGVLRQLIEVKNTLNKNLNKIEEILNYATIASRVFPGIGGYPKEQTYLILFQNNTEMRPTGGFIGSFGILKMKNGEIINFKTEDTYNLDNASKIEIRPPEPLIRYLGINNWYLRDSNWSPDFPEAAKKAEWFYHEEGGQEKLDGVIAITPTVIEELMKVTGPIVVPGYDYEFTPENVTELLQFQVEEGFEGELTGRKKIIEDFSNILFHNVFSLPKEKWIDVAKVIQKVFQEKHLLLYLDNEDIQKIIAEYNGDGRIKQTDDDYLFVVDCNLGALKSDPEVKRTINYSIDFIEPEPKAKVSITYDHRGEFTWKTTRYRTYTRVYVPEGSVQLNISGYEENEPTENNDEYGKKVLGAFISIEPGESKQLIFEYKLPLRIKDRMEKNKEYKLLVQKQPGTIDNRLNVELKFNDRVLTFTPEDKGIKIGNKIVVFNTDLTYDREFMVEL